MYNINSAKNILLISYTFPPKPGIGGRRWAKFCKYLQRQNVDVHVLCQNPIIQAEEKHSEWIKDIVSYKERIKYFNIDYPSIINQNKYNFTDKVLYRFALFFLKKATKGNYYDRTIFTNQRLLDNIYEAAITNNIKNIIITAGPFFWLSKIIKLKEKLKDVNFIVDFRDPWCNNKTSFGYAELTPKRLNYELKLEEYVIKNYDYVISVSDQMNNYFIENYNTNVNKFLSIPNGFDLEDFEDQTDINRSDKKLYFIFTGTLYDKVEYIFKDLIIALDKLKENNIDIYSCLEFTFYGYVPKFFHALTINHENIKFLGTIPLNEVYKRISGSDLCMLFLSKDLSYSLSTKFYEYVSQKKTLAVFSSSGFTSQFIEDNNLGYAFNEGRIYSSLLMVYSDWKKDALRSNINFDTSGFDVAQIATKVRAILN